VSCRNGLMIEQRAFAIHPPRVPRQGAIIANHPMTGDRDRDVVCGAGSGDRADGKSIDEVGADDPNKVEKLSELGHADARSLANLCPRRRSSGIIYLSEICRGYLLASPHLPAVVRSPAIARRGRETPAQIRFAVRVPRTRVIQARQGGEGVKVHAKLSARPDATPQLSRYFGETNLIGRHS
jgi:hypothetical protein